jgi:hypothetical protein
MAMAVRKGARMAIRQRVTTRLLIGWDRIFLREVTSKLE